MKTTLKQTLTLLIAGILVIGGVILAGSLTPTTGSPEATYVSLNDIYDKLTTGATTTEKSFTPTTGTSTPTMHTLTEIFDSLPEWLTLDNSTTTVTAGYYEATDLATVDTDLAAANIVTGATIFGVEGSYEAPAALSIVWADSDESMSDWNTASSTCAAKTTGGYTWRLPTSWELLQKYVESNGTPVGFELGPYWSGTVHPMHLTEACAVGMVMGIVLDSESRLSNAYVRCVRDAS